MSQQLEECASCLGSGEDFNKYAKGPKSCKLCGGEGVVQALVNDAFINQQVKTYSDK